MKGAVKIDIVDQNKLSKNAEVLRFEEGFGRTYVVLYRKDKYPIADNVNDEMYVLPILNKFQKTLLEELDASEDTPLIYKLKLSPNVFLSSDELIGSMVRPLVKYYVPVILEEYDVNLAYSLIDLENGKKRVALVLGLKSQLPRKIKLVPVTVSSNADKLTKDEAVKIFKRERRELRKLLRLLERAGEVPHDFARKASIQNFVLVRIANAFEEDEIILNNDEEGPLTLKLRKPSWDLSQFPDELSEQIRTVVVKPILESKKYALRGIIITGPPGMGKSVLVDAIGKELKKKILDIEPSIYRSMWYGQTEKILRNVFNTIKTRNDLIVLIDDAEFLANRTMTIHEGYLAEISVFLKVLQEERRPLVALTANHPEIIDPALVRPGRIDAIVVMGYPDETFRRKIVSNVLKRYEIKLSSSSLFYEIVRLTRWFSAAEIDAFVRMAAMRGSGKIDSESLWWARKKFSINENERRNLQERLLWNLRYVQGIVISYVKEPDKI